MSDETFIVMHGIDDNILGSFDSLQDAATRTAICRFNGDIAAVVRCYSPLSQEVLNE